MATCTHAVATADTGATPNTSGTFTPAVGDLLVAFVGASNTVEASPTLTSSVSGFTFSLVDSFVWSSSNHTGYLFVSNAKVSSASSQSVTFNATDAATGTNIIVTRVSGMTQVGLSAIRQTAKQQNQSSGTTPAPAFGAAALTGNVTIGYLCNNNNPAGRTEPTDWTEGADIGYNNPTIGTEYAFRNSGFTGTTITWGSTYGANGGSLIVELDCSASSRKGGFGLMGMGR